MKNIHVPTILIALLVSIVACTPEQETATVVPTATAPAITLTTSGSGSVTPILAAIADEFEAENPGFVLEVLPGSGTGGGVRGIVEGTLDIAAMSRPANDSEVEQGVEFIPFGHSVTVVIAHPGVGVSDITAEQLIGIFKGEITNWSEVGGNDLSIIVYVRDPAESNTTDIRKTFIGEEPFTSAAQVMTSQTDMQDIVSGIEGAIGYGTWATIVANGTNAMNLVVDGIGVENAPESLTTIMGIGYLTDRAADFQPFIDWLVSDAGQGALQSAGVTPIISQ